MKPNELDILASVLSCIFGKMTIADTGHDPKVLIEEHLSDPQRKAAFVKAFSLMMSDRSMSNIEKVNHFVGDICTTEKEAKQRLQEIWRIAFGTTYRANKP